MDMREFANDVLMAAAMGDAVKTMRKLREKSQQKDREGLIRKLIFKARDLSEGISKCRTPEEMASVYDYIQKDADEIARLVTELQNQ